MAVSFTLDKLPTDANIDTNFEQQDFAVIHREVNANLKNLQRALNTDKQVKFKVLQSYMSEYDIISELILTVSTEDAVPAMKVNAQIVEQHKNQKIEVYGKTSIYNNIKSFIQARDPSHFSPPLLPSFESKGGIKSIHPYPNKPNLDPRRTGRIVQLDPIDTINTNSDWFINNSLLYGFLLFGDESKPVLIYVGLDKIKAIITDQNLLEIVYAYTMAPTSFLDIIANENSLGVSLTSLFGTKPTITASKVKTFSAPLPGISITTHNATLNDGQTRPNLVVVDGQAIVDTTATAFLKMQAAAKTSGVSIYLSSGFRPALGIGIKGTTVNGKEIRMTTQEELRRDSTRWVKTHPDWAKYPNVEDFVMKATSGAYNPATAPPKSSQHGNGIAVDVNTGGRNNFQPLKDNIYKWMVENSWKFGFIRTVSSEEWHYEYQPTAAIKGPYAKVAGTNANKFYTDLSLDTIRIA